MSLYLLTTFYLFLSFSVTQVQVECVSVVYFLSLFFKFVYVFSYKISLYSNLLGF